MRVLGTGGSVGEGVGCWGVGVGVFDTMFETCLPPHAAVKRTMVILLSNFAKLNELIFSFFAFLEHV